jgi:DNA-binding GntR family transcriptional regulator
VRRALEVLENEALIVVKHPQGRFVRQDRERSPLRVGPDDDVVSRMPTDLEVVAYDMEGATPLLVVTRADGTVEHYSADQHSIRGR